MARGSRLVTAAPGRRRRVDDGACSTAVADAGAAERIAPAFTVIASRPQGVSHRAAGMSSPALGSPTKMSHRAGQATRPVD